jgi:hypothetical protein
MLNERNILPRNGLWRFCRFEVREDKARQSQFPASRLRDFGENQLADGPEGGNNRLNDNNQIIEGYKE